MVKKIKPDNNDMWILLMSTIRYSMGRRTYMSFLAGELVIKYHSYLTKNQLLQIVEEIERELKLSEVNSNYLGSKYDHEGWKENLQKISQLIESL